MGDIRVHLTDKDVARLPLPEKGWYLARDTELKGFFVVVGKRRKTFTVQGDLRKDGLRQSIRVAIGEAGDVSTRDARNTGKTFLALIAKGEHPRPETAHIRKKNAAPVLLSTGVTLRSAWERYRDGHMMRKDRSPGTIASYQDHVERVFAGWLDTELKELADNPSKVAAKHDAVSRENGPYIANGSMRTLRAIYNHARKTHRYLPADNPVTAIDWNGESRRNSALGLADVPGWFAEVAALDNPIRREFHLLTFLSGCRPAALKTVQIRHIDFKRRFLHIAAPKGGAKKAFDIPLSREMIRCLLRAQRFGRQLHPAHAIDWVFPADSASGHLVEQKENRKSLSKWGNDLRQSFRTLAQVAGVSEFDARLLMNHAVPGVNAGYITRHKLLEDHLRGQQQAISSTILAAARVTNGGEVHKWLGPPTARRAVGSA